jgi:hypothetical protein
MQPVVVVEDAAARRWAAERALRMPLLIAKFGAPLLVILAVGVLVYEQRAGVEASAAARAVFVLIFGLPFLLLLAYPALRWWPQRWTIDAAGIAGHGRRRGQCAWSDVRWWGSAAIPRVPACICVQFGRATGGRKATVRMIVPAAVHPEIEAWFRAAAADAECRELPRAV